MAEAIEYRGEPVPVRVGARQVVQLPPRALRVRLKGLLFDTSRTFLLPRALNGVRRLKALYEQYPGASVLIVGHADAAGAAAYNLTLSRQRAEAVGAFLADRVDDWLAWYRSLEQEKAWGTREDEHMLSALGDADGPFLDGAADDQRDETTKAAVRRFQEWSNQERGTTLAVDGIAGEHTRRALIAAYMAQDGTSLPPGTTVAVHGCGELHPEVATADGVAEEENRRVEVFLFEGPIEPAPQERCPAPGCAEHAQWVARAAETIDLRDQLPAPRGRTFTLELTDDVLLPEDAELVVHGLPSPLRLRAAEHHDPEAGRYAFAIHDPPPGARCRATLVSTQATLVLFDRVDLSRYVEEALAAGSPPFLPIDLPDEAFQTREVPTPEEEALGEQAFVGPFEDLREVEAGERDFPPQPDRAGALDEPERIN